MSDAVVKQKLKSKMPLFFSGKGLVTLLRDFKSKKTHLNISSMHSVNVWFPASGCGGKGEKGCWLSWSVCSLLAVFVQSPHKVFSQLRLPPDSLLLSVNM